jgi:Ca-activated chloride channel family protein
MPVSFSEFHFLRPEWFLLALPFVILAWRLLRKRDAAGVWQSVCDDELLPYLLVQRSSGRSPLNAGLFLLCGLLAIAALAGPAWERLPAPVFRDESALVLILDLSRSMDATDISPSRLERAKFKITDILRERLEGQTALIVYAAEPYVVTPLTSDVVTIESQLPALRTNIMPSQGSSTAVAIEKGIELLAQGGIASGDILLVTDGIPLTELEGAKYLVEQSGIRISILGVGTSEGAPIPDANGGFVKDVRGNIVVQPLQPDGMRELAAVGNGLYHSIRVDDKDITLLLASIEKEVDKRNTTTTDRFADRWREFGPWLLLAVIPFAPLAFRRGVLSLAIIVTLGVGSYSEPAAADWWSTPDQQGQSKFLEEDFSGAAAAFEDPAWRAAANYRAGNYAAAALDTAEHSDPESSYNTGNAHARLGQYAKAIAAYDQTLSVTGNHEDALHNKALLEELLEEQEQQNQQSDSSEEQEPNDQDAASQGEQQKSQSDGKPADNNSQNSTESSKSPDDPEESSTSAEQENDSQQQMQEPEAPSDEQQAAEEEQREGEQQAQSSSEMENEQATEQWLRQIPDDPGGLLRRKFEYEFQKKYGGRARRPRAW